MVSGSLLNASARPVSRWLGHLHLFPQGWVFSGEQPPYRLTKLPADLRQNFLPNFLFASLRCGQQLGILYIYMWVSTALSPGRLAELNRSPPSRNVHDVHNVHRPYRDSLGQYLAASLATKRRRGGHCQPALGRQLLAGRLRHHRARKMYFKFELRLVHSVIRKAALLLASTTAGERSHAGKDGLLLFPVKLLFSILLRYPTECFWGHFDFT